MTTGCLYIACGSQSRQRQRRKGFATITGKRRLDNRGKKPKKADLAQQFPVFAAAGKGAAAVEGELLRQAEKK